MSGPTRGGVTVKVLSGRTAASLQRYRDSKDEGTEQSLFAAARHCSHDVETQIAEWKAVREQHGTQGARRVPKGRYETVDPETGLHASGQRGTHVKYFDGKRYRKRLAGPNETPTHLRIEPEDVTPEKESEATHTIYAFGADMVNPENPEDLEHAFLAVKAERDRRYPGLQESMWGERNGESGLFHVHVASNATVYRDFTLDGVDYSAGQKMGGALTGIDDVRAGFEQHLDQHLEYGFKQSLARVGTSEYEKAQRRAGQHAYWETKRGKETNQDRIRREAYEALSSDGVTDRATFVAEMRTRGIAVEETGLRRGKHGKGYDLLYTVDGAKQGVKGRTLGPEYAHNTIDAQLALKAAGQEIELPAGQQRAGEMKPLPLTSERMTAEEQKELDRLRADVAALAQAERAEQAVGQTASELQIEPNRRLAEPDDPMAQQRAEAERRMAEMHAQQEQRVESTRSEFIESLRSARASDTEREQRRAAEADAAAEEPKVVEPEPVTTVPARFADLSDDDLAARVDELVIVRMERLGSNWDSSRMDNLEAMRREHDLSFDEANYLARVWWDRDRPEVASERVVAEQDIAEPVPDIAQDLEPETAEEPEVTTAPGPSFAELIAQADAYSVGDVDTSAVDEMVGRHRSATTSAVGQAEPEEIDVPAAPEIQATTPEPDNAAEIAQPVIDEPEPTPEPEPWQSGLRGVRAKGRDSKLVQQRIDGMAVLEEDYRAKQPDAEFERRITAKDDVGGVNDQFLRDYGEHLDPAMREQLDQRTTALESTRARYEAAKSNQQRGQDLRMEYERVHTDPARSQEARQLSDRIASSDRLTTKESDRVVEVRDLVKDGRYGDAVEAAERHVDQDRQEQARMAKKKERISHEAADLDYGDGQHESAADRFTARAKAAQDRDQDSRGLG